MTRRHIVLLLALLLIAVSCRRERAVPDETPVFIISIDTLRSDRLPIYGYAKGSTPAIDAFRRDAVLFRKAFSHSPQTLPSHVSMMTGQLPTEHQVRDNIGYALSDGSRTLPEVLKENGYATGAAVSSFVLRKQTGFAQGFDFFDDYMTTAPGRTVTSGQRSGDAARESLTKWLSGISSKKVFGLLHLYEPHAPYTPPPPFNTAADPYDGEVSAADAIVGKFLEELRARGLYDDALIILLSDHGEGLGDHGEDEHGVFVYREAIQVPLLVKLPKSRQAGSESAQLVGLTDVMPTILAAIGIDSPKSSGRDMLVATTDAREIYSESYYGRIHLGWSEVTSLVSADRHFIEAPRPELYQYLTDPREVTNVIEANRREAAAMRQRLGSMVTSFQPPQATDPEEVKKLTALGYLGSTAAATSGPLPDPKDRIGLIREFRIASGLFERQQYDEAIARTKQFLAANPDFIHGWGLLAASYRAKGQLDPALQAARTQLARNPANPQLALSVADLLLDARRFDEAARHAELALDEVPYVAHELLARIAFAQGSVPKAQEHIRAGLAAEPDRVQLLLLSSQIARAERRTGDELRDLTRAVSVIDGRALDPVPDVHFRRGELLLQQRRIGEAEGAFRRETNLFPRNLRAWVNLALVLGAQGRRDEARGALKQGLQNSPGETSRQVAREALEVMGDLEGVKFLGLS